MLVVTRRQGESLIIETPTGETIQVTIVGIKGAQVRLGTTAPTSVNVIREELVEPDSDRARVTEREASPNRDDTASDA